MRIFSKDAGSLASPACARARAERRHAVRAAWLSARGRDYHACALVARQSVAREKSRPLHRAARGAAATETRPTAGFRATPGIAAYGASKGAVRQLTKSVAAYCGRKGYNIRCNSIHPGMVRTPLGEAVLKYYGELEERAQKRAESVPLGTLGEVEDVAYASLYLASDEARYINSSELIVDGGMLGGCKDAGILGREHRGPAWLPSPGS